MTASVLCRPSTQMSSNDLGRWSGVVLHVIPITSRGMSATPSARVQPCDILLPESFVVLLPQYGANTNAYTTEDIRKQKNLERNSTCETLPQDPLSERTGIGLKEHDAGVASLLVQSYRIRPIGTFSYFPVSRWIYDTTHHFAPVTKLYNVERRDVIHYSLNPSFRSTPSQQHAGHATFFPSCNAQRNRLPGIRQACTYVHKLGGEMVD
jgi:hypothetical protein